MAHDDDYMITVCTILFLCAWDLFNELSVYTVSTAGGGDHDHDDDYVVHSPNKTMAIWIATF